MKNDWRSWRTHGSWLADGQKQDLDDLAALLIILFFVAICIYNWFH